MSRRNIEAWPWWRGRKSRHWSVPAHFSRYMLRYRHRQVRQAVSLALRADDFDNVPGKRPRCLRRDYW